MPFDAMSNAVTVLKQQCNYNARKNILHTREKEPIVPVKLNQFKNAYVPVRLEGRVKTLALRQFRVS